MYSAVSPIHYSEIQEPRDGNGSGITHSLASLTVIIPSNPLAKFLLSAPMILCSAGLEVLVPEGECFHQETQK